MPDDDKPLNDEPPAPKQGNRIDFSSTSTSAAGSTPTMRSSATSSAIEAEGSRARGEIAAGLDGFCHAWDGNEGIDIPTGTLRSIYRHAGWEWK